MVLKKNLPLPYASKVIHVGHEHTLSRSRALGTSSGGRPCIILKSTARYRLPSTLAVATLTLPNPNPNPNPKINNCNPPNRLAVRVRARKAKLPNIEVVV